jgi:hypothetical protein
MLHEINLKIVVEGRGISGLHTPAGEAHMREMLHYVIERGLSNLRYRTVSFKMAYKPRRHL